MYLTFRDRDRDKRRDKYSTSSSKSHSNSNTEGGVLSSVLNSDRDIKIDKDKEQAKLEDEMQKRRERIEQWRAEKVSFIYYVSTFIAQNLIWLPNFSQKLVFFLSKQKNVFFNIIFWRTFHTLALKFLLKVAQINYVSRDQLHKFEFWLDV